MSQNRGRLGDARQWLRVYEELATSLDRMLLDQIRVGARSADERHVRQERVRIEARLRYWRQRESTLSRSS